MTALGTRLLTLEVASDIMTAQVSNCRITGAAADSDFVSFADAASGGSRERRLEFTASQNMEEGSLWDYMWNHAGETVAVTIRPAGGTVASATQPHFVGNVVIEEPDGDLLGGEANSSTTAKFTWEGSWPFTAKPTRVIA